MIQARKAEVRERYTAPAEHNHRAVPARRPRAFPLGRKGVLALFLCGCFLLGLVIIAQYSHIVSMNYRVSSAETRLNDLKEEYRRLELEAARLGSLARIESVARVELGMREPESSQLRVLTASRDDGFNVGE